VAAVIGGPLRRIPAEVLADSLFADVEDRTDLVEGTAEFSELVSGAFAAHSWSLAAEGGAGLAQRVVPFGGRALDLFGFALCC
jgi:hypothetical protein